MRLIRDIFRSHAVFDEHGRHINGSDKQSNHSYGDTYESLFRVPGDQAHIGFCLECGSYQGHRPTCSAYTWISTRDRVKLVMEVGVADGSCLRAWCEVFPNAHIVGMDIHPSEKAHGDRIEFHLGDQVSRQDCERAAAGRKFDLIIEDATHQLSHSLLTLFWLWPFVALGGMYVVEEWSGVHEDARRINDLWPNVEIIGTCGPNKTDEPLVVFKKTRVRD